MQSDRKMQNNQNVMSSQPQSGQIDDKTPNNSPMMSMNSDSSQNNLSITHRLPNMNPTANISTYQSVAIRLEGSILSSVERVRNMANRSTFASRDDLLYQIQSIRSEVRNQESRASHGGSCFVVCDNSFEDEQQSMSIVMKSEEKRSQKDESFGQTYLNYIDVMIQMLPEQTRENLINRLISKFQSSKLRKEDEEDKRVEGDEEKMSKVIEKRDTEHKKVQVEKKAQFSDKNMQTEENIYSEQERRGEQNLRIIEALSKKKKQRQSEDPQNKLESNMKDFVTQIKFIKLQIANLNKEKQKLEKKVVELKQGEKSDEQDGRMERFDQIRLIDRYGQRMMFEEMRFMERHQIEEQLLRLKKDKRLKRGQETEQQRNRQNQIRLLNEMTETMMIKKLKEVGIWKKLEESGLIKKLEEVGIKDYGKAEAILRLLKKRYNGINTKSEEKQRRSRGRSDQSKKSVEMIRTVQSQSKKGAVKRQDPQKQDKREGQNKGRSVSLQSEGDKLRKSLEFKNMKKGEKRVRMEDEMIRLQERQGEEVDLMKMNEQRPGMMKKGKSKVLDLSKSKSKEKQKPKRQKELDVHDKYKKYKELYKKEYEKSKKLKGQLRKIYQKFKEN